MCHYCYVHDMQIQYYIGYIFALSNESSSELDNIIISSRYTKFLPHILLYCIVPIMAFNMCPVPTRLLQRQRSECTRPSITEATRRLIKRSPFRRPFISFFLSPFFFFVPVGALNDFTRAKFSE